MAMPRGLVLVALIVAAALTTVTMVFNVTARPAYYIPQNGTNYNANTIFFTGVGAPGPITAKLNVSGTIYGVTAPVLIWVRDNPVGWDLVYTGGNKAFLGRGSDGRIFTAFVMDTTLWVAEASEVKTAIGGHVVYVYVPHLNATGAAPSYYDRFIQAARSAAGVSNAYFITQVLYGATNTLTVKYVDTATGQASSGTLTAAVSGATSATINGGYSGDASSYAAAYVLWWGTASSPFRLTFATQ